MATTRTPRPLTSPLDAIEVILTLLDQEPTTTLAALLDRLPGPTHVVVPVAGGDPGPAGAPELAALLADAFASDRLPACPLPTGPESTSAGPKRPDPSTYDPARSDPAKHERPSSEPTRPGLATPGPSSVPSRPDAVRHVPPGSRPTGSPPRLVLVSVRDHGGDAPAEADLAAWRALVRRSQPWQLELLDWFVVTDEAILSLAELAGPPARWDG